MPLSPNIVQRLILFIFAGMSIFLISTTSLKYTSGDFDVYYNASHHYLNHAPVYEKHNGIEEFKYSPLFALCFSPLTFLKKLPALYMWTVLNLILLYLIFHFLYKLKQMSFNNIKDLLIVIGLLALSGRYLFLNFRLGQVNLLLCFLMLFMMYLEVNKKYFWAGVVLAFSLMIKFIPLLFVIYFLLNKRFKLLAYTGLMIVIFLFLPSVYTGFSLNMQYLHEWLVLLKSSPATLLYSVKNCSLLAYFSWIFVASQEHCAVTEYYLIQKGLGVGVYVAWVITCFVLFVTYYWDTFFVKEKEVRIVYLEYSCLFICGLLFNPLAYLNALTLLIIPYFFILRFLFYSDLCKKHLLMIVSFIAFSFILTLFDNKVFFKDPYLYDYILKFKPLMWAIICVYLALVSFKYSIKQKSLP